jgi:TRAP-type C4-dicarboxylate transport system substrate-binding protein
MSKKRFIVLLGVMAFILLAQPVLAADKIVLRAVSAWPKNSVEHDGFFMFIDEVNKKLAGRVEIKYLGASDVVKTFSQFEMLGKGMFEIGHLPGNYAKNVLPIAETLHLSRIKPWQERENGVYDIMKAGFADKMNIEYLCKIGSGDGYLYQLYSNFPVNGLGDFKGKTFRVAPVYVPLLKKLGAGSVSMPPGEIYTAMERGVVDGFGWPTLGILDFGWTEVTKYRIDPGFYPVGLGIFLNLDKWNKLPADIRSEIESIAVAMEKTAYAYYSKKAEEETAGIQKKGMKIINLPPGDAKQFVDIAFEEGWKDVIQHDPKNGPKLKSLTTP